MALFDGLDIPPELETLFNALLSLGNNSSSLGKRPVVSSGDTLKKRVLNNRSLFILWKSLYDGFDSTRKGAWQLYWATLPFGSHSGSNGWPGSGYSAFVYINAPIYRVGGDLLLDPPSTNIIVDPNFTMGNAWWDFDDTADWESHDGFARCTGGTNGLFSGDMSSPPGAYALDFDVSNSNNGNATVFEPTDMVFLDDAPLTDGHQHYTGLAGFQVEQLIFLQQGFTGDITNVVLIRTGNG